MRQRKIDFKIIELKNKVCSGNDNNFVVINQKGIDPPSLDILARAGGAGAFEVAARQYLINEVKKTVQGVTKCLPKFSLHIIFFKH
ncbi:T-complex protein 1 subunit zeta 1-like [Quercus robur]|uniref:T-complex protein 1 subunit zeta 1-like n=1 Tax=Quercus robur TaxID=38942 RepID=UPI00216130BD|nr:T-complex protein 1 subunit zeta 1-like [Quercus robur]